LGRWHIADERDWNCRILGLCRAGDSDRAPKFQKAITCFNGAGRDCDDGPEQRPLQLVVLYDYPPSAGGLATQGDLLFKGLREIGVDVYPAHFDSAQEKAWYYRWFQPDVVVGVGYWGHTPDLVLHPLRYGARPVPWLVADGYIANYAEVLNSLQLILVTSNWVRETYIRDGNDPKIIEVLPVGCDTDSFIQRPSTDTKISIVREIVGISPDQVMILTVGGDAASKGFWCKFIRLYVI